MSYFRCIIFLVTLLGQVSPSYAEKELRVTTTIPYLLDITQQVTCHNPAIQVTSLVPFGIDPHHVKLTPQHRLNIAKADIVFFIGIHFDDWIEKIKPAPHQHWSKVTTHLASSALRKIDHTEHEEHHHHDHHHHHHFSYDPHIWHSPRLTKQVAQEISAELKKLRPALAPQIQECTTKFLYEIDKVVLSLQEKINKIPVEKRIIATNHDSFGYFVKEFGLQSVSLLGLSTHNAPTPQEIKKMITTVKEKKIKAIFSDSLNNTGALQTISQATGAKIGGRLYSDTLDDSPASKTILALWQTNMATILEALQ